MMEELKRRIEMINRGEVPDGYKRTESGIVPVEWKETMLRNLLDFKNGINADKEKFGSGIKLISVMDILDNSPITYESIRSAIDIDKETLEKYSVTYGDILFQRSSENFDDAGKSNVYLDKNNTATYSGFVIRGKKIAEYDPFYLNELLKTQDVRKQIKRLSAGSQHINIGQESLAQISINIADASEQQKIAEILMKWDEVIGLQEKLIGKLEIQRKALTQMIFTSQEGWGKFELGTILKESVKTTKILNEYPVISSTKNGLFLQKDFFDKEVASKDNIGYKILKRGQIVLSPQNLWMGNINYNDKFDIGMVSPSYKIFSINESFNKKYIACMLKTERMFEQFRQVSEQGASIVRRNLNMELFSEIVVSVPNIYWQEKIGEAMTTFDYYFELNVQKLSKLKKQQTTIRQLLLTGIVRVNNMGS